MIIALKITQEDQEQAARLLEWIKKLGGFGDRFVLLCVEQGVSIKLPELPKKLPYTDAFHHFPESNNIAFQEIANYCKEILKSPFLYMEANAVPLRAGWLDDIDAAYRQAVNLRKPFMGDVIKLTGHPDSFAPVGVYPPNITDFAGEMMTAHDEEPWTVAAAGQMGNWTVKTTLIRHAWDGATIEALGADCVLVHPDRTGSFLETLSGADGGLTAVQPLAVKARPIADAQSAQNISVTAEPGPVDEPGVAQQERDVAGNSLKPAQVPWENKDESIEEIKRLCARLKDFCSCPAYTSKVRAELKAKKVTR